jgi:hypothetical protein
MKEQQFQDMVVKGIKALLKQGCRCVRDVGNQCKYYNNGDRCIVGHMMTDKEIKKYGDFECSSTVLITEHLWLNNKLNEKQVELLHELQLIHDNELVNSVYFKKDLLKALTQLNKAKYPMIKGILLALKGDNIMD